MVVGSRELKRRLAGLEGVTAGTGERVGRRLEDKVRVEVGEYVEEVEDEGGVDWTGLDEPPFQTN